MLRSFLFLVKSIVFSGLIASVTYSQDNSGPYLAARQAVVNHNYGVASDYFSRALEQSPEDKSIMGQAMAAFLAAGDVERAHTLAQVLDNSPENPTLVRALKIASLFKS